MYSCKIRQKGITYLLLPPQPTVYCTQYFDTPLLCAHNFSIELEHNTDL